MRRFAYIAGGVVAFALVTGALYFFFGKGDFVLPGATDNQTVRVPDFTFPDASGNPVSLSDVQAELRVLTFWASWSPYSTTELPALAALKERYGEKVAVIALNRDENPADGKAFLASLGLGDTVLFLYDSGDTYYTQVGGYAMPETVFLDKREQVLAHVHGPMTPDQLEQQVQALVQ